MKTRNEIDARDKWRLEDIFESNALWEREFLAAQAQIDALPAHSGALAS